GPRGRPQPARNADRHRRRSAAAPAAGAGGPRPQRRALRPLRRQPPRLPRRRGAGRQLRDHPAGGGHRADGGGGSRAQDRLPRADPSPAGKRRQQPGRRRPRPGSDRSRRARGPGHGRAPPAGAQRRSRAAGDLPPDGGPNRSALEQGGEMSITVSDLRKWKAEHRRFTMLTAIDYTREMTGMGIPVMGHLGLTPTFVNQFGGYRVQGRSDEAAERILSDAQALEAAGAFAVVLEGVPSALGERVTKALTIPTIGI